MKVVAITATSGRHSCLERSVRFFLDQDYQNCVQLIYQNSKVEQRLNSNIDKNKVILVNQYLQSETRHEYRTLGEIYTDALRCIPEDADVIIFWDDDDIFLPNHISEGVKGLISCGKTAYKPAASLFKSRDSVSLVNNTLEPSIFTKASHIKKFGFNNTTSDQHLAWVNPLVETGEIFADINGLPTLCYTWGETNVPVFKTSGNPNDPMNFDNYKNFSKDHGDRIITPISKQEAEDKYYKKLYKVQSDAYRGFAVR